MQPGSDRLLSYLYAKSDRPHIIPIHPRAIAYILPYLHDTRAIAHTHIPNLSFAVFRCFFHGMISRKILNNVTIGYIIQKISG
jgi:hypothetical protein